jgi:hypothetical protein
MNIVPYSYRRPGYWLAAFIHDFNRGRPFMRT